MARFPKLPKRRGWCTLAWVLWLVVVAAASAEEGSEDFGTFTKTHDPALIGIFYDLKQNQKREPTGINNVQYKEELSRFLREGWNEAVLNQYFRATRPLYATQLFITARGAGAAPAAFGVEDFVAPMMWVAHYKGQVRAPATGRWRFWGSGDDVMAVAVNGKTVLVANFGLHPFPGLEWKSPEPPSQDFAGGCKLQAGKWVELKEGEVVDLDIIFGEVPGGLFSTFLLVEREGQDYGQSESGEKIYPVFRLAPRATPPITRSSDGPVFAADGPVWRGLP